MNAISRGGTPAATSFDRMSEQTLNRSGSGVERSLKTSCVETVVPGVVPDFEDSRNRAINLGVLSLLNAWADEAHVQRRFTALACDLQHVVHRRIDTLFL